MLKRIWKPFGLVLIIGILAVALFFQTNSLRHPPVGTGIGESAPDFTGTILDGETVRLSDFCDKIVLVNEFASWCGPCLIETPHLVDVYNTEGDEVVFIGINIEETEATVTGYREEFSVSYPLVLNEDGELTELYRPIGLPTSWFIDPDGVIRYVHAGPMTTLMLEEALDAIREGREPDVFSVVN